MREIILLSDHADSSGHIMAGSSGLELTKILNELGIDRADTITESVLATWVADPKRLVDGKKKDENVRLINGHYVSDVVIAGIQNLFKRIGENPDRLIIGFGDIPLMALTGNNSVSKYRGSMFQTPYGKFLPTYHPRMVHKVWKWRFILKMDIARALNSESFEPPEYDFVIRPTFEIASTYLNGVIMQLDNATSKIHISCDIETSRHTETSCVGLGFSRTKAICIPILDFTTKNYSYWERDQEIFLIKLLRTILTHPMAAISGQNYSYDEQYFGRNWGFVCKADYDAMLMHHVLYPGELPKGLDFISSMYCQYHMYWKDDGKEMHDAVKTTADHDKYWLYNCKDAVATWEAVENLKVALADRGLTEVWEFQHSMMEPLLMTMLNGVKYDREQQIKWRFQLDELMGHYEAFFNRLLPDSRFWTKGKPWYRSPTKLKTFLYDILKMPLQIDRKTKRPTTSDQALQTLIKKEPLLKPLLEKILEYRSLGVFKATFLAMEVGSDKRMHSSYNLAGTVTFRLSSRSDSFGTGGNLQNIPKGDG
jgi:uracil-DNA glycosylase